MREYYSRNPEPFKERTRARGYHGQYDKYGWASHLQRTYGISPEQYYEMLDSQNGVCAICRRECPTGKRLAVDHCHKTGTVRGLLCQFCNSALSGFQDNVFVLSRAINYLISDDWIIDATSQGYAEVEYCDEERF